MSSNSRKDAGSKRSHGSEKTSEIQKQPRNPRSAFMCFTDAKRKEIAEWRKLAPKERAFWEEEARNDKVRFVREKAEYKGEWITPKKRAKKDPNAPKRPMSAFLKFSKVRRPQVKKENPFMGNTDISRLLGEMWRNADPKEKKSFQENELLERAAYNATIQKWREEEARKGSEVQASHHQVRDESIPQPSPHMFTTDLSPSPYGDIEGGPYEPYSMQSVEGVFQKGDERNDSVGGSESVAITPDHSMYRRHPGYSSYRSPFVTDTSHSETAGHYSRRPRPPIRHYDSRPYESQYHPVQATQESKYRTPHYGSYHFS